ncbi:hypothetical protein MJ389_11090 [Escherichia coli]|nr:hypothetical protein MJ389_11090 [Escherichia coli]
MDTMEGALVEPAAVGMHAAMLADVKPGKKMSHSGGRLYWFDDVASVQMPGSSKRKSPLSMCWKNVWQWPEQLGATSGY